MINCIKMNGNGNDFLVVDNMNLIYDGAFLSDLALKACRRREAVGADGILVAEPSERADFKMRLFNSDGSEGEMCGNGSRCIARFAYESGIVSSREMTFETLGGSVRAVVDGNRATLDLAPVTLDDAVIDGRLTIEGAEYAYCYFTVGVPHAVVFEEGHSRAFHDYVPLGRAIRHRLDLFPKGTNVNFAAAGASPDSLDVMTYERGVEDMTLSCGTGSTASSIAAWLTGRTGPEVEVKNPGGINHVLLSRDEDGAIIPRLEGGALIIAEVALLPEALR